MKLTGTFSASIRSFVLVAPPQARSRTAFWQVSNNYSEHQRLMREMQQLRGRLYLKDGAIEQSDLASDGRHILPTDEISWHLLTVDTSGRVLGCTRYLQHTASTRFQDLRISHAALATCPRWGAKLRRAVQAELAEARLASFSYAEVGGWAMAEEIRCTTEALRSVLATYAWGKLMGGVLGISTATERNGSASILRRLGGRPLEADGDLLPPYFDPAYRCNMEMIRFDSRHPNPRYKEAVDELASTLQKIPVVCAERPLWHGPMVPGYSPGQPVVAAAAAA